MTRTITAVLLVVFLHSGWTGAAEKADGYRGIWFTLGQRSEYGDKYSGGLGTYTANHVPIAIYSEKANKTFFVYGGTKKGQRHLLIMASYFDHDTGKVPRPTIVYDKKGVNDPHDNGALMIDDHGYLYVFTSGRARGRPGFIHRSVEPYSVEAFELLAEREMTYPQPRSIPGKGLFHLMTRYTKGRELYWETSSDGKEWATHLLAGFGGHYQVSGMSGGTIGTAFMWHPGGKVDARTNLYYAQTSDLGSTWSTADGKRLAMPLRSEVNDALLIDYRSQSLNVYIHDLNFDARGYPAILYLTSRGHEPGPSNDPRTWRVTRWTGQSWETSEVCTSTHNYDTGCLFIDGDRWSIFGPTGSGPQKWGTGGEMQIWASDDAGKEWRHVSDVTGHSPMNHSYARRVVSGKAPFEVTWADGDSDQFSESRLFVSDRAGKRVLMLPTEMGTAEAEPSLVKLR